MKLGLLELRYLRLNNNYGRRYSKTSKANNRLKRRNIYEDSSVKRSNIII